MTFPVRRCSNEKRAGRDEHLRFGYKPLDGGPIRITLDDVK